ncbi:MAG: hypothetical protein ACR2NK_15925, partial [Mariniblastus sp.]
RLKRLQIARHSGRTFEQDLPHFLATALDNYWSRAVLCDLKANRGQIVGELSPKGSTTPNRCILPRLKWIAESDRP